MKTAILIVLIFSLSTHLYSLRSEREGNYLIFYNDRDLKVKAYYILNDKVIYVYRYYYDTRDLCIREETWKKNRQIAFFLYTYHSDKRLKMKKYYYKSRLMYYIVYDRDGEIIEHKVFKSDKDKKAAREKKN
ncbi:MAG: hypothetical protein OEZ36_09445 [Spirochaetota bacterium]|nr:hypothetical protein [Spirochaetota bacterium]